MPDGSFVRFKEIELGEITRKFSELALSALCKEELLTDEAMSQILSQEHSGFSVWFGEPFDDAEEEHLLVSNMLPIFWAPYYFCASSDLSLLYKVYDFSSQAEC